jgi:hypothetical protein
LGDSARHHTRSGDAKPGPEQGGTGRPLNPTWGVAGNGALLVNANCTKDIDILDLVNKLDKDLFTSVVRNYSILRKLVINY